MFKITREGNKLILEVEDVTALTGTLSSTGKSEILASTGGYMPLGDGLKVSATLIKPLPKKKK